MENEERQQTDSLALSRRPYLFSPPRNNSDVSLSATALGIGADENERNSTTVQQQLNLEQNMAIRYRLFNRLNPGGSHFLMPTHVIPDSIFSILPFDDFTDCEGKQSSLITIFSIWNTMMGTSLLALPWALQQAGLILGLFFMLLMAFVAFYTAYRVVQSPNSLALESTSADFSDVCRYFWGKSGEYFSVFFSVLVLLGGIILYFVLMSNFLYYTGNVIYESLQPNSSILPIMVNKSFICDVYCPTPIKSNYPGEDLFLLGAHWLPIRKAEHVFNLKGPGKYLNYGDQHIGFQDIWKLQGGVPIILALCVFPLLNFRSPSFFMRFNVLGTISVLYLICFTLSKAIECGMMNANFVNKASEHFVQLFNWKFPALTGTLALSYFIHNAILTILRNQKHPENNSRDLFIGYMLTALCYILIGVLFFLAFPTNRNCISDNFLNNFGTGDVLSAVARIFLLFQMLTVLPLLMYLIRVQFSYLFAGTIYPGFFNVLIINIGILTIATFIAVVYPHVGPIIRYVGSISGLVYIFLLPCAVHLKRLQLQGRLTFWQIFIHSVLILCGVLNFLAQFLV